MGVPPTNKTIHLRAVKNLAYVAGPWNYWGTKNRRARGRHAGGEGAPARKAHENRFNSHSVSADISSWLRGSRGKK